jgi:hypothetical protein
VIGCEPSIRALLTTAVPHANCKLRRVNRCRHRAIGFSFHSPVSSGSRQQRVWGVVAWCSICVLRPLSRYVACYFARSAFENCVRGGKSRSSAGDLDVSVNE